MTKSDNNLRLHAGAKPQIFENARELRTNQTKAEIILWNHLRARRFDNLKFRRQHPILHFIADFYCHELRLIVEIDGEYHEKTEQQKLDNSRTQELEQLGYSVVRFQNNEVFEDVNLVLNKLRDIIHNL